MPNLTVAPLTDELRQKQEDRENELTAGEGIEDRESGFVQPEGSDTQIEDEPAARRTVVQMSPSDAAREAIANKFRRPGVEVPFDGDMTKPENLYGEVAAEELEPDPDAPEPGVPQRQEPANQPRMVTVKVRGREVQMTEDEVLTAAQKTLAADTYLEDARALLEEAKTIKADRAGQTAHHPERQTGAEDEPGSDDHSDRARHPGLDLKSVVEKIQFGDPEEAARELAAVISTEARREANEGHIGRLVKNDLTKSQEALKAFTAANPALAKDRIAAVAIENTIYDIYREEIAALGMDEAQIPKDPKTLADWHRFYRVNGHPVSNTPDVLTKAKGRFEAWRGTSSSETPKPAARKEAPRVAVNVDRTERRMAIPNSPSRAVAPRRDAPVVTQTTSRSEAVKDMRRARGQPV